MINLRRTSVMIFVFGALHLSLLGQQTQFPKDLVLEAADINLNQNQQFNCNNNGCDTRNGAAITARGDVKVLLIFAGFTNYNVQTSPTFDDDDWPADDGTLTQRYLFRPN